MKTITKEYLDKLTYEVTGAVIEVHKALGSGLLESVYHKCMKEELKNRGIVFTSEQIVKVKYKGIELETEFRCDMHIAGILPVEFKAVEELAPIRTAQILSYMKLFNSPKGILPEYEK